MSRKFKNIVLIFFHARVFARELKILRFVRTPSDIHARVFARELFPAWVSLMTFCCRCKLGGCPCPCPLWPPTVGRTCSDAGRRRQRPSASGGGAVTGGERRKFRASASGPEGSLRRSWGARMEAGYRVSHQDPPGTVGFPGYWSAGSLSLSYPWTDSLALGIRPFPSYFNWNKVKLSSQCFR